MVFGTHLILNESDKSYGLRCVPFSPFEAVGVENSASQAAEQFAQCRNKNSFELISAHCTSSHARRAFTARLTWSSAAFVSCSLGSRDSVARYNSLSVSALDSFFAMILLMRLLVLRRRSLT